MEDIEHELYEKNPKITNRPDDTGFGHGSVPGSGDAPTDWSEPPKVGMNPKTKRNILIGVSIFLFLVLALVAYIWYLSVNAFALNKVAVRVQGPSQISSGSLAKWQVSITNENNVAMQSAQLDFQYPEGSMDYGSNLPVDITSGQRAGVNQQLLGNIDAHQTVTQSYRARLIGAKNDTKYAKVTLSFSIPGVSARQQRQAMATTTISDVPIVLTLNTTNQLVTGNDITYEVDYFNTSQYSFSNLRLRVKYPPGFTFQDATPQPSDRENTIWTLPPVAGGGQGSIVIHGTLDGQPNEAKPFKAIVEAQDNNNYIEYTEAGTTTTILASPLDLTLTMNGGTDTSADIGSTLNYVLKFRNNLSVPLQNLTLSAALSGNIFELSTLNSSPQASFDVSSNTLTWIGAQMTQLTNLPPSAGGQVTFSVRIRDRLPIVTFQDKNFTLKVTADISTNVVPPLISASKLERQTSLVSKVNSRLVVIPKVYYHDNTSSIQNYGPVPPRVGQTTTYTVHLIVMNISNDADNVTVATTIPTGVTWTGQYTANFAKNGVEYNPNTKRLTWNLGKVVATTGIAQAAKELVYQVSITPAPADKYQVQPLVNEVNISGSDDFTLKELSAQAQGLSTTNLSG